MRYLIKSLVIFLFFICADKDNTFYLIRQVLSSIFDKTISILSNILDKIHKNNLDNTLEIPYRFHHIHEEGAAKSISSAAFTKKHRLKSPSATQSAVTKLLEDDVITKNEKIYSVTDPLLAIWLGIHRNG